MVVLEVRWSLTAQKQLLKAYKYILEDSFQNAEKVKQKILLSTRRLNEMPEIHPLDKYRLRNKGNFRAYEIYHYRIVYKITKTEIIITRIRHTKMEPKVY
jgi:plasmid stabilization system protein ParE